MPVSRNFSLPPSIEARNFKKRPGELQCLAMSSANKNWNCNNNSDFDQSLSSTADTRSPSSVNSTPPHSSSKVSLACRSRSSAARINLSHPCMSEKQGVAATTIFPHLFLGCQQDVIDEAMMKENNITNVLNVSSNCARPSGFDDFHFRRIPVKDNYQERIISHLDEAVEFIESVRRKNEKVLVHCLAGVSRSATVAIAYVMHYLRLNFDDAYRFVKDKRPTISPNFNFLGQLMEYERKLRDDDHYVKPRTGSIPDDVTSSYFDSRSGATESKTSDPKLRPDSGNAVYRNVKLETSFLSKPNLTPRATPSSSLFCRRLKDANLANDTTPTKECDPLASFHSAPVGGAGVVLDLHVSVPFESHMRRLGSDGIDEEEEGPDDFSPTYKSNSFPRNLPKTGRRLCENNSCATTPEVLSGGFREKHQVRIRSFTAPSTPAGQSIGSFIRAEAHLGRKSALERLFPLDVEMTQPDEEREKLGDSPPSPSRVRDPHHSSPLYFASDCLPRDDSYASPMGSLRTDKTTSRKTKSPKITKKSLNSGVRPPYHQALRNTKHLLTAYSHMPQRNRTKDPTNLKLGPMQPLSSFHCDSPGAEGISSLTLYSPVIMDKNPLEIIGRGLCASSKSLSPNGSVALPVGSQSLNAEGGVAPQSREPTALKSKVGSSFQLASGTNLKLKWRNRSPRPDVSSDKANSSRDKTQTSSPVIGRPCSGNVEMISCS